MDSKQETHLEETLKRLKFLSPRQVRMIDDLLASVGPFGEVRLEVKDGRLRFASRTESMDALKWERDNEQ